MTALRLDYTLNQKHSGGYLDFDRAEARAARDPERCRAPMVFDQPHYRRADDLARPRRSRRAGGACGVGLKAAQTFSLLEEIVRFLASIAVGRRADHYDHRHILSTGPSGLIRRVSCHVRMARFGPADRE